MGQRSLNVGKKEYGFLGKEDGSSLLTANLPTLDVKASNPCRYCLGGAGAYGPWNPDAFGVTLSGSFILGGGGSISLSFGVVGNHVAVWLTTEGGTGFDVGAGLSVFASSYIGKGKPTVQNYMGISQSNNLNLGPYSFGESTDITKGVDGASYYGKNWVSGSVGVGLSNSDLSGVGGSSRVGYSSALIVW